MGRPRIHPVDIQPVYMKLAHRYVDSAIRHGDIPKLDGSIACVDCREPATEYDHRDYLLPLQVDPVCMACNQARGPGRNRAPSGKNRAMTLKHKFELGLRGTPIIQAENAVPKPARMPKLTKRQQEAAAKKRERIHRLSMVGGHTQKDIARICRCSQQYVSKVLAKEKVA